MNLIVFDIDDTLTKSEHQHQFAYVNAMRAIGITGINQKWKEYLHHTDSFILKVNYENNFVAKFDVNEIGDFEKRMTEIIETLEPVKEIRGARKFVDFLRNKKNMP